ncbi:MAG TPA: HD domain-containing phosphohydrolase, partial [Geobacteraceae bacterium]
THALNVSLLSTAMARTMDLPDRMIDAVGLGALCHDVGKERIPVEVLRKPGKLTDEEKALMDRHPVEGAAKVLAVPGVVAPLVPVIAFEHHMRADGSGYPKMPVPHRAHPASMMVAVADTFDALRTVRPYQDHAFTPPGAMTILIREARAGRHHSVFVSVFARLVNIITPGRKVKLTDGRPAVVLATGEFDALAPLVETEEREILDLSMPGTPGLEIIEEDVM